MKLKNFYQIYILIVLLMFFSIAKAQENLYDPTRHTLPTAEEFADDQEGLTLNAIMMSNQEPLAIINGLVLKRLDTIEGFRLTEINKDYVVLTANNNKKIILKLETIDVKTPHVSNAKEG